MLTKRTSLLTAAGLLTTCLAAAQTPATAAADGPTPVNILSWVTWAAAAIVLLMAFITGSSVAAAVRTPAEAPATPATPEAAAERLRPASQPQATAPVVDAEELTPVAA